MTAIGEGVSAPPATEPAILLRTRITTVTFHSGIDVCDARACARALT
jgi:hypothetical protein